MVNKERLSYKMEFFVKVHKTGKVGLVAICDEDVLGKTFEEGDLWLKVDEHFYSGELVDLDRVFKFFNEFSNFNLAGNEVVKLAVDKGIVSEENVLHIGGVSHACIATI